MSITSIVSEIYPSLILECSQNSSGSWFIGILNKDNAILLEQNMTLKRLLDKIESKW